MVVLADRHPAADDDEVGAECVFQGVDRFLIPVGDRLRCDQLPTGVPDQRRDHGRVRVPDLTGFEFGARLHQLVAAGQDRDPGPAVASDEPASGRREDSQLDGTQAGALAEDLLAGPGHLATPAYVVAGPDFPADHDAAGSGGDVLDSNHRIGPLGQHGSGRDPDRFAPGD